MFRDLKNIDRNESMDRLHRKYEAVCNLIQLYVWHYSLIHSGNTCIS